MSAPLLHVCGPIAIHSFGLAIAAGAFLFMILMRRDPKARALHIDEHLPNILFVGILAGIVGGRALYFLTEQEASFSLYDFLAYWDGGFSILGTIIGIFAIVPWYVRHLGIPIIPFLDIATIYAPLLQSVSRIGCFLAGCCYGAPTNYPWGVVYTDQQAAAPLGIPIHPTQIYSSLLLLAIFAFMYFYARHRFKTTGALTLTYLMLVSAERFIVDFWRDDRPFPSLSLPVYLSTYQLISLGIFLVSGMLLCIIVRAHHREKNSTA